MSLKFVMSGEMTSEPHPPLSYLIRCPNEVFIQFVSLPLLPAYVTCHPQHFRKTSIYTLCEGPTDISCFKAV